MSDEGKWRSSIDTGTYEETISSKWMTTLFGSIATIFLSIWIFELLLESNWSGALSSWFWFGMFLLFFGISVNFWRLKIKMNSENLPVRYGIIRKKMPWDEIEDCQIDETSALRYGGWGIRFTRVGGRWRTVYNVVGSSKVVVSLNEGLVSEFAFSTRNPEEAMEAIKLHLRKRGKKIE